MVSTSVAFVRRYAVATHWTAVSEAPSCSDILGRATLTMLRVERRQERSDHDNGHDQANVDWFGNARLPFRRPGPGVGHRALLGEEAGYESRRRKRPAEDGNTIHEVRRAPAATATERRGPR